MAAMVTAPEKAHAGQLVFGPLQKVMTPQCAQKFVVTFAENGVEIVPLFPTSKRVALILATHLPTASVAAEKRRVAAIGNELLEIITHRGRPIFIVSHTQNQPIVL